MAPTQIKQNPNPTKQSLEDSDKTGRFDPKSPSDDFIERQKNKFYSLRQGGRTVAAYGAEFMKLLAYVDDISGEKVKLNIFISGLNQRIGSCVRILEPSTLSEAMRKAVLIEEETKQRKRRLDDSYVSDGTDRFCRQYLPDLFIQCQVYKFFSLRQGRRTVAEYSHRLMELYTYVRCLTEQQLWLNKFISGLNLRIRPIVRILEPSTISEASWIGQYIERRQENPSVNFEGLLQETLMLCHQRRSE